MKYKCPDCANVLNFPDELKCKCGHTFRRPIRQFAIIGLIIGLFLGAIGIMIFIHLEITSQYLKDQTCNTMIENASNISAQYGVAYGMEYAIATITEQAIQCKELPMDYANYSYTLIAAECLQINQGGNK